MIPRTRQFVRSLVILTLAPIAYAEEEEYVMPDPDAVYHSNLGKQEIVKVNLQKNFDFVGQSPDEIAPGSIPLGSLRDWAIRKRGGKPKTDDRKEYAPTDLKEIMANRKIENWVGSLPSEVAPGSIPLGEMQGRQFRWNPVGQGGQVIAEDLNPQTSQEESPLSMSLIAGVRPYYTSNVLRLSHNELDSGVVESNAGFSLITKPQEVGPYLTLVPRLDFLMILANYGRSSVKDLLNYQFGIIKPNLDFRFPRDWSFKIGVEYDFLHSLDSGDKMFDAVVPSLGVQKIFTLGESTFMLLNGDLRYSLTNKELPFPVEGVFADDGDNLQTSVNLTLIQAFLEENQLLLMPSLGFSNTHYLKNLHDGRNDFVVYAGISGAWQVTDYFSLQLFMNYSNMASNSVGDALLGPSSAYEVLDIGASVNLNFVF